MKQVYANKGFTLIELLVVIAIIGILSALLLPAVNGVRKKGYETRAKSEIKAIETAVKAYITEYSKLPVADSKQGNNDMTTTEAESRTVMKELIGENPRKILFLESKNADGTFLDPWNRQYLLVLDTDYDNLIEGTVIGTNIVYNQVVVYSRGDKGTNYIFSFNL